MELRERKKKRRGGRGLGSAPEKKSIEWFCCLPRQRANGTTAKTVREWGQCVMMKAPITCSLS